MKKLIILINFLFITLELIAPLIKPAPFYITINEPIIRDPFRNIKYAIGMVECHMDTFAINQEEQAYGYFQIRQIRLDDYYARTGIRYTLEDMLDYYKAEEVFMYYARQIGYKNPGLIARTWNGSGSQTWKYWDRVRKYLKYDFYD